MLIGLVIAQDLDLHSASEDDHEPEITYEDDQSDEEMSSAGSYRSDGEEEQPAGEMEEL